jgi:hypothetical protein
MIEPAKVEAELLAAAARQLREQGYDVVLEPSNALLPKGWGKVRPDAIAIGRSPKLVIEIAAEGARSAQRIAELQNLLRLEPDWKLHLILNRSSDPQGPPTSSVDEIRAALTRIPAVLAVAPQAALLMCWVCTEALSRLMDPDFFARPQSPGRIVERLASGGRITPTEAEFLRSMASMRNAVVHGDLSRHPALPEVTLFSELLKKLLDKLEKTGRARARRSKASQTPE